MPQKLYRFQPLTVPGDDRLSQLKIDELWFSDPEKFNDPFDLKPSIKDLVLDRWCDVPEFKAARRRALACLLDNPAMYQGALFIDPALFNELQAWTGGDAEDEQDWDLRLRSAIETRISQFGVACLTSQWDSRLMWAHYASNGQGFCIEYEVNGFANDQNVRYVPVLYASETPELCFSEAMFTPHQFLQRVMASKHADWAYEQEVRLVCLSGKALNVKLDPNFVRMTGLVASHAMQESFREDLKQTATRLGVKAWRVTARQGGSFEKTEISS